MKRFFVSLALLCGLLLFAPAPTQALAQPLHQMAVCGKGVAAFFGFESWDSCLKKTGSGVPKIESLTDIWLILFPLLEDVIKATGYVSAGFIIWGGIKYIKSQGDPGQINEARTVITNALIGLVLALLSVAIVQLVAGTFR